MLKQTGPFSNEDLEINSRIYANIFVKLVAMSMFFISTEMFKYWR